MSGESFALSHVAMILTIRIRRGMHARLIVGQVKINNFERWLATPCLGAIACQYHGDRVDLSASGSAQRWRRWAPDTPRIWAQPPIPAPESAALKTVQDTMQKCDADRCRVSGGSRPRNCRPRPVRPRASRSSAAIHSACALRNLRVMLCPVLRAARRGGSPSTP